MQNDELPSAVDIDREIGRRIRLLRIDQGYTLAYVAKGLGLTYQQLQKYENGGNRIAVSTLYRLSRVLEVPIAAFFEARNDAVQLEERALGSATLESAQHMESLRSSVRASLHRLITAIEEASRGC